MASCLIVDDSRVVRAVARRILEELQLDVREAENGRVALDRCNDGMPDLILLDWNMPVMDGLTFLRTIRAEPLPRQPKIVLCSTQRDIAHICEALDAGADEYIMKPFDQEIMYSKLVETGIL